MNISSGVIENINFVFNFPWDDVTVCRGKDLQRFTGIK